MFPKQSLVPAKYNFSNVYCKCQNANQFLLSSAKPHELNGSFDDAEAQSVLSALPYVYSVGKVTLELHNLQYVIILCIECQLIFEKPNSYRMVRPRLCTFNFKPVIDAIIILKWSILPALYKQAHFLVAETLSAHDTFPICEKFRKLAFFHVTAFHEISRHLKSNDIIVTIVQFQKLI